MLYWMTAAAMLMMVAVVAADPPSTQITLPAPVQDLFARTLVTDGDFGRLHSLFEKARRGEPIVLGFFGGSITQGTAASTREKRWTNLTADWFKARFPAVQFTIINAGIGVTGSPYGCLRVQRDLLSKHPDLVVIDFGVNDGTEPWVGETYEGCVRQILAMPTDPAVMEIFFMHRDGGNAQANQAAIAKHYGLPAVSYRDALWPTIQTGKAVWANYSPDDVHPNDWGHAFAAGAITHVLDRALASMPTTTNSKNRETLPPPIYSDTYAHTKLLEGPDMNPARNKGWFYEAIRNSWIATEPGSVITFEMNGTAIFTMFHRQRAEFGIARLTIDGGPPVDLDGWFDGTWGSYRETHITRDLKPGKHIVQFELLNTKDPLSTGHEFRILGLGSAGVSP